MEYSLTKSIVIVGTILVIAMAGCGKNNEANVDSISADAADEVSTEQSFAKVVNVEVYPAKISSFEDYITLPVVVMPNKEVNLGLTAGGKVTAIHVDKGDRVRKGEMVLETDNVLLKASYDQALANFEFQEAEFARSEKLFSGGTITAAQHDGAKLQIATARNSLTMAKKQYEDAVLKAPLSGIVTMRNVEVGDILGPGTPAFRIIDVNTVKVQAGIPEKHIALFKEGNTVAIGFDALPDKIFEGRIDYISPEASTSVRTFLAEILVNNSDRLIRAGIMGDARILRQVYENTVMVPINALIESQRGRIVFVAGSGNKAEERYVEIGAANDTMIRIITGINPGDRVIVKGQQDLVNGEAINITGEYVAEMAEGTVQ